MVVEECNVRLNLREGKEAPGSVGVPEPKFSFRHAPQAQDANDVVRILASCFISVNTRLGMLPDLMCVFPAAHSQDAS